MQIPEEKEFRIKRLKSVVDAGINPYPSKSGRTLEIADFKQKFSDYENSAGAVVLAGRIMSIRGQGGMVFVNIKDDSGTMQVVFKKDEIGEEKHSFFLNHFDRGDFIETSGNAKHTKRGEPSLFVANFKLLSKSILPLPEKWHGLTDIETRFRKRYLDLIMNDEVKNRMVTRSKIIMSIRKLLDSKGFLEVETPTLQPVYGGGFAKPFKTHHNALDSDFYLRISDEMYLKRLIVGGFEKVYEITKVFRNEGIDHDHNPEFTMFEAQIAYQNYEYGMDIFEEIFEFSAKNVLDTTEIKHGDVVISLKRPWKRMRLVDAVEIVGELKVSKWKDLNKAKKELKDKLKPSKQKDLEKIGTLGELIAFAFEELVEEKLIQPTIIFDYPIEVSPLAKKCADDPRFTERFEVFALGSEIGNNYSELNDPIDLENRFINEKKREEAGFDEAHQTDYDYLEAVAHGMPPICGLGIGVDRMLMLLTGAENIKEVILFPTLRIEQDDSQESKKTAETKVAHAVLLNDKALPIWSKFNTVAHLSAAFAAREGKKLLLMEETQTKDGNKIPMDIQHAIMVMEAQTSEELLELKEKGESAGLLVTCITEEMQGTTDNKKVKVLHENKNINELKFLGVLIFGEKKEVENLTKMFPLMK